MKLGGGDIGHQRQPTLKRLASVLMAKLLFKANVMSKPPLSGPSPAETESPPAFVARQEDKLNRVRKAGAGRTTDRVG